MSAKIQVAEPTTVSLQHIFEAQQAHQYAVGNTTAAERIEKLRRLGNMVMKYRSKLYEAMFADYKKPSAEVDLAEIYPVTIELKHAIRNLEKWLLPQPAPTPTALSGAKCQIQYEPKGVVLIISPWNFPFNLTFAPLVSAVAAGNCAIIKPSELTPHTSALMREMLQNTFEPREVALVEGGAQTAQQLLAMPFNHIFFTGSPRVGKIVMRAAAEHLASVTLELGGKSPAIVTEHANLDEAATKIGWAKFFNNGQVCIAPDYVLVHESKYERLVWLFQNKIKKIYGETTAIQRENASYGRVVNAFHFERLKKLVEEAVSHGAEVVIGGEFSAGENFIAPTVLVNVPASAEIMETEIFGPVLPIVKYKNLHEALQFINEKPKPLGLYLFSRNAQETQTVMRGTRAGGTCINDCAVQFFNPHLPFGGVNNSGIGKSHGFFGFEAFSNARAVLKQPTPFSGLQLMSPPYSETIKRLIDLTVKWL